MNTRILRMCERTVVGRDRIVRGLGQLQPTLFVQAHRRKDGTPVPMRLAIEGAEGGRPCWWKLPLPGHKAQAKRLFAELEAAHREGRPSAAAAAHAARSIR